MSSVTHEVKKLKNYINGEWIESTSKQTEIVVNPATGEAIAEVPLSTKEDVDRAVQVANEAFKKWSRGSRSKKSSHIVQISAAPSR